MVEIYIDNGVLVGIMIVFLEELFIKFEVMMVGLLDGIEVEFGVWDLKDSWML